MFEGFDFNQYRPPVLPFTMRDEKATRLRVTLPTVDLQEKLLAHSDDLLELLRGDEEEKVQGLYELAAELLSCNRNLKKITAEQLREVYNMEEEDLAIFFDFYTAFVKGVEKAKN